jgi:hypothetical protein
MKTKLIFLFLILATLSCSKTDSVFSHINKELGKPAYENNGESYEYYKWDYYPNTPSDIEAFFNKISKILNEKPIEQERNNFLCFNIYKTKDYKLTIGAVQGTLILKIEHEK